MKVKKQSHETGSRRTGTGGAVFAGMVLIIGGALWML
jgi:hypothetical protein